MTPTQSPERIAWQAYALAKNKHFKLPSPQTRDAVLDTLKAASHFLGVDKESIKAQLDRSRRQMDDEILRHQAFHEQKPPAKARAARLVAA